MREENPGGGMAPEILSNGSAAENAVTEVLVEQSEVNEKVLWGIFGLFFACLFYAYWNMLTEAAHAWNDALYSHGYLIPGIAAVLLWLRRQPLQMVPTWQRLAGVGLLAISQIVRVYGSSFTTLDMWTSIPAFIAIILIVGGLPMLRWAGPVAVLLVFMFPIPWHWEQRLLMPMQGLATKVSTFFLLVLGFPASQDGYRIILGNSTIGIVDACSGLRMTTILLALSFSLVLLNERKHWENAVILIMAIPIALLTNVIRIIVTAITIAYYPEIEKQVHDIAGFCMVPLAIAFLVGLQAIMSSLFVEDTSIRAGNDVMESPEDVFWRDRRTIQD